MRIGEILLSLFCRKGAIAELHDRTSDWSEGNSLSLITKVFPGFLEEIKGKRVLDHGCGKGWQCVALAKEGAMHVVGCDMNLSFLEDGAALAREKDVSDKVDFLSSIENIPSESFDIVLSLNSMEHFKEPLEALSEMMRIVCCSGRVYVTFGPPWYAPYGSHMHFFTWLPWVNILFSEETIMSVRARFREDGAKKYTEVPGGLNKMSIDKFEGLIANLGLRVVKRKYDCVKNLNFLSAVTVLKELTVNRVSYVLAKSGSARVGRTASLQHKKDKGYDLENSRLGIGF